MGRSSGRKKEKAENRKMDKKTKLFRLWADGDVDRNMQFKPRCFQQDREHCGTLVPDRTTEHDLGRVRLYDNHPHKSQPLLPI